MPRTDKLSLKTFWDAVEGQLAALSTDELRSILRALAVETRPLERRAFLDKLKPAKQVAARARKAAADDELLSDIDDLVEEFREKMGSAEEPWEDERHGYWDDDYYNDEDSVGPYEEFVEPLAGLFDRAEAAFDYGNLPLARDAYRKLFEEALHLEDDYGRGVSASDLSGVDIGEACARYLRAVYETKQPARRPASLLEQMRQMPGWIAQYPTFDDILQISPKPLPDQDRFLADWIALLRKQSGNDADAWLREAVRLLQGAAGLEELARAEGKNRPRAYLDWFTALEEDGKHRETLTAAQEALQKLPAKLPIRAAIADHLCAAAAKLKDDEALRAGRWEAFAAKPTLPRLLDLWDAAPAGERPALMQQAADRVKDYLAHPPRDSQMTNDWREDSLESPAWIDNSILAHIHLLAGDWDAAHQLAVHQKPLGWSSRDNPQGLAVAAFLALLSGKPPATLPANLAQLWQGRLQASVGFGYEGSSGEGGLLKRLEKTYAEQFPRASLSKTQEKDFLAWCLEAANQRVDAIVGGQHRGSYDKAAVLIAACAETLRQRGHDKEADAVLDDVRNRFPRHRAFLAELDTATQRVKRKK